MKQWVAEYQHPTGWRPFKIHKDGWAYAVPDGYAPFTLNKALKCARLFREIEDSYTDWIRLTRVRNTTTGQTIIL